MLWFYIFAAVALGLWLSATVCGGLAVSRAMRWLPHRFASSLVIAVVAFVIGYFGVNSHIRYSQTVNGRGWSVDSSWFFWVPLALGVIGFGLLIWRRMNPLPPPEATPPPKVFTAGNP